jgi:hypothetical protein
VGDHVAQFTKQMIIHFLLGFVLFIYLLKLIGHILVPGPRLDVDKPSLPARLSSLVKAAFEYFRNGRKGVVPNAAKPTKDGAKPTSKAKNDEQGDNESTKTMHASESDSLVLVKPDMPDIQRQIDQKAPVPVSSRVIVTDIEATSGLPVGSAWLYLYESDSAGNKLNYARRVLKFSNKTLARLLCGPNKTKYFFEDVPYLPTIGAEAIVDDFVREISVLLDRKRKAVSREAERHVAEQSAKKAIPVTAPAVKPAPTVVEKTAPREVSEQIDQGPPEVRPAKPKLVPRAVQGMVYEGTIVESGQTWKHGPTGTYRTFVLTINDGRTEVPLTGTELERLVRETGVEVGDKVRVVSMGRCPVDVPGQAKPHYKNLYQLTRIGVQS